MSINNTESIYSQEFIDEMTCYYDNAIQKTAKYLQDLTLQEVWNITRGNTKNVQNDTRMLFWYLAEDGSEPHPQFTDMCSDECVGCGIEHAIDTQFRMGSECHELYKQRAKVLKWAVFAFWWNSPDNYMDTTQRQNLHEEVEKLKTFCSSPVYQTTERQSHKLPRHSYSVVVPEHCKSGDILVLQIPLYAQQQSTSTLNIPQGVSNGKTFQIVFNTRTYQTDDISVPQKKIKPTTTKRKYKHIETDKQPTTQLRRSKRIRGREQYPA